MTSIFVKHIAGSTIRLNVNSDDNIETLKEIINVRWKIPPDQQRLIFGCKQLQDGRTLADYNIKEWSTLDLSGRLCGGSRDEQVFF
jgi:ubiquitin